MSAVPGLKLAIKEYESDKVKERAAGGEKIREIFGNRENLLTFQESASREGGAGWTVLFQCLFQAVIVEKKAVIKRNVTAQADRRLADAVSLVRWMAERSVHFLSRKPLQALVRHMTALLVHASTIFPPTVRDYAKALRTLLSYPPHLENLEERDWKKLMSLCWAGALGDRVMGEEQWEDEGQDELDESQQNGDGDDDMLGTPSLAPGKPKAAITQAATELLTLVPILLSSPSAPILPPFPTKDSPSPAPHSVGYSLLTKVNRFLEQRPTETSGHIAVLRACNTVLIELELNSRTELVQAGTKLLPSLTNLWLTRNKVLREQVLIAVRLLLPWLCHDSVSGTTKEVVQDGLSRLADSIAKESAARWGIEPLDLQCIRIASEMQEDVQGFRLGQLQPGFDFTHEMAFAWAVMQLYADAIARLRSGTSTEEGPSGGPSTARSSKRRKVEEPLQTLLDGTSAGSTANRLLHLQALLFIIWNHSDQISRADQNLIRSAVVDGLESDDEAFQSWSLICLASIQTSFGLGMDITKVWASATRKVTVPAISRAACFCANTLLKSGQLGSDITTRDIGSLLRQIDIQGPPHPYDSTCHFLSSALGIAQSDVRLYSQSLEDKVIAWLHRHDLVDGPRGRSRMDGRSSADVLQFLCTTAGIARSDPDSPTPISLPECPIVERILEEIRTRPVRLFVLHGEIPKQKSGPRIPARPSTTAQTASLPMSSATLQSGQPADAFLSERQIRLSSWISRQIKTDVADWKSQGTTQAAKPSERLRKALDLAVLAIAYQTSLKMDGVQPDENALTIIKEYLDLLRPEIANASQTSIQLFIWQAFLPLLPSAHPDPSIWPISLRASDESGIRSELLPASVDKREEEESGSKAEHFLVSAWNLPEVAEALREIVAVARRMSDVGSAALNAPNGSLETPQNGMEEDDFGEIRVAETDAMPVSKEALDSQRTAITLLHIVVTFRLAGTRYLSPSRAISKDLNLLNAFLSADGIRMLQLGQIICDAVLHAQLRLTDEAIDLITGLLEELLSTYAYSKDEGLYLLVISFLRCSAPIWLLPEKADSEMAERAMVIAQHVVRKTIIGQVKSWRVRLHVLLFLDDYLDYEPSFGLWTRYENDTEDDGKITPPTAITSAMVDRDLRVRVRAATSTAGLFYLPALPAELHQDFYLETMGQQPRQPDVWNAFLTDMLWKLNCCTASSSTRPAALYHLYEVPFSTSAFDLHLQRGLEAVATRLGLSSTRVLWVEYIEVIVPSLLSTHSKTLALAPSLSGYVDNKDRAISELDSVGPALLASNTLGYFNELCEVAGTSTAEQAIRYLLPATARHLLQLVSKPELNNKSLLVELNNDISSIPCGAIKTNEFLANSCEAIVPYLFDMLQAESDWSVTAEILRGTKGANADLLQMASAIPSVGSYNLDSRVPAADVLRALAFLGFTPSFDRRAACFNTLLHLFAQIDRIFLVAEQYRLISEIILVIATFADTFDDGRTLQLLILEAVSLLDRKDIGQAALQVVEWGFAQIPHAIAQIPKTDMLKPNAGGHFSRLSDIVARLGRVRCNATEEMAARLDDWVVQEAVLWRKTDMLWSSFAQAATLWPEQMKRQLGSLPEPTFADIADLATAGVPSDSMVICERLSGMINSGDIDLNKEIFAGQSFWQIKDAFSEDTWTQQGAQAFVAALAAVDGQIGMTDTATMVDDDKLFFAKFARSRPNEPVSLVQALLIRHLFQVVDDENRSFRAIAYRVLRQLRPTFDDLVKGKMLPQVILNEVALVRSPLPIGLVTAPVFTLDNLRDDILLSSVNEPEVWLRELSLRLCDITSQDQPFFAQLRSFIPSTDLRSLLPLLVQAYLATCEDKKIARKRQIALERVFHAVLRNGNTSHTILHAILEAVLHLRSYKPPFRNDALGPNFWLQIDFLLLAEAGVKVGSYATALMFLEIAKADVPESSLDLFDNRVQKIMLAVYSNINDPDGFYGVKTHNIKDALRMRLDHEGEHLRAFGLHGADLEADSASSSTSGLLASAHDLHSVGLHRTALSITQSVRNRTEEVAPAQDLFFEIAWRTGDWDLPVPVSSTTSSAGAFYSALRSLHRSRDYQGVQKAIDVAMKAEMLRLKDMGSERMSEIQKTVDNLLSLREISQWLQPTVQRALLEGDYNSASLRHYSEIGSSIRYPLAERLHATRMSILDAAQSRESRNLLGDLSSPLNDGLRGLQTQAQLSFSGYARAEGNIQAAINAITAVQHIEGTKMSAACADEYGEVLWAQNEHSLALQLAEGMKKGLNQGLKSSGGRYGILTGRIAYWSYRAKLLPVKDASDMFYQAYGQLTAHKAQEEELATLSHDYATFAAEQQAVQRLAPELSALREYRERKAKELALLQDTGNRRDSRNTKELRVEWQAELESDAKAITEMEERIDTLTKQALKMFACALRWSDRFDDSVTKMCSLWLAHCDPKGGSSADEVKRAENISRYWASSLDAIPSRKFVFLGPQLAARLHKARTPTTFNSQLNGTVLRLGKEHPYHILYQIIPLAQGEKGSGPTPKGRKAAEAAIEGRSGAAADILAVLGADQVHVTARTATKGMILFAQAAMPWCLAPPGSKSDSGRKAMEVPANQAIRSLQNVDIPIATCIPVIQPDLDYSSVPKLLRYSILYSVLGGIHRPKRMKVYDMSAKEHHQLFKGEDEIRQDAVMEQVFDMTNKTLAGDRQTKTRNLRFRTYVVIPLAHKTGILEFVAEGVSIGDWLKPAHTRYQKPGEITTSDIREAIRSLQEKDHNDPNIKTTYEEMIPRFPPVMRHFFKEKHKDPMAWFSMRLRYSRSAAVTSMVGWILGIGDRHLSNIMIDQHNGELIHIDFGIVFEAGRNLRIPEKVPFRLTNDMLDGLGITGVDGTFRRCSEQTIRVLRANSDLILTVLEVFKHDPLYAWESEKEKTQRVQGGIRIELNQSSSVLEKADRVLGNIRSKLRDTLSAEYTVNMLVQEARDTENLAKIYHGWHPWF